ncbi:MAG TPA: Trm112 family protein [Armatimonadota bacterium]|nr:Trm112 family protein [Armatimonadota bacterium]
MFDNLEGMEKILACPVCHAPIRIIGRKVWCTDAECRRSYPIDEHDLPHMLEQEATIEAEPAPVKGE